MDSKHIGKKSKETIRRRERRELRRSLETEEQRNERLRRDRERAARRRAPMKSIIEVSERQKSDREATALQRFVEQREKKLLRDRNYKRMKSLEHKMKSIIIDEHFHMKEGKYMCNTCNFTCDSKVTFRKHFINQFNDVFNCSYCDQKFNYEYDMIKHEFGHVIERNGDNPLKCDKCLSDHQTWKIYYNCRRQHKYTKKHNFTCKIYPESFGSSQEKKSNLNTHKVMGHIKTPVLCEVCGKMVTSLPNFHKHYRTHTGEKPYKCEVCDKKFATHCARFYHYRIHTGVKPYKCNDCGKMFSLMSNYKCHRKIHSGEKPFECAVCSKRCITRSILKVHMRTHTIL